ncbi:hypothetical protein ACI3ER_12115 [Bacillus sp. Wb]
MGREVLFKKEIMFHQEKDDEILENKLEIIKGLEALKLKYSIEGTTQYGTHTPTWEITVYK